MESDLILIESFVKSYLEKDNIIIQTSVQSYYVSAIYTYWDKYKNYILEVDLIPLLDIFDKDSIDRDDIEKADAMIDDLIGTKTLYKTTTGGGILAQLKEQIVGLKYITDRIGSFGVGDDINDIKTIIKAASDYVSLLRSNLDRDEKELIGRVNMLQTKFNESYSLDIVEINRILISISNKICISSSPNISPYKQLYISPTELKPDIYPLINTTGLFSYNTYLYALFNGIFLVGLPERYSIFDSSLGCSERFHKHDLDHARDIRSISANNFNILRHVYNSINSSSDISKSFKEEFVHTLFYWVHESSLLFTNDDEPFGTIDVLSSDVDLYYRYVDTPMIILDPLSVDTFILHNGPDLHSQDELYLQSISHLNYGYEQVQETLRENYSTNDNISLDDRTSNILYYMKICNLRLMRYIHSLLTHNH